MLAGDGVRLKKSCLHNHVVAQGPFVSKLDRALLQYLEISQLLIPDLRLTSIRIWRLSFDPSMPRTTRLAPADGDKLYTAATATAAFNGALKVLSDAAKRKTTTPLQETKANGTKKIDYQKEAEKASSALAWMRTHEKELDGVIQPQQLDSGTLAFLGKCIALRLFAPAWNEALALRRRLNGPSTKTKAKLPTAKKREAVARAAPDAETTKELLDPQCVGYNSPATDLDIQLRIHTLKLLAAEPNPRLIESALPYLDFREPTFLGNIIAKRQTSETDAQVLARQLETIAQICLNFCPSTSTSNDGDAKDNREAINPQTAYQLQATALHTRRLCWKLVSHRIEEEKEVWAPLHRYVTTFLRRALSMDATMYQLTKAAYLDLSTSGSKEVGTNQVAVLKLLSSNAQSLGLKADAKSWITSLQRAGGPSTAKPAVQCSSKIRLAIMALAAGDEDAERCVDVAIAALEDSSKHSDSDYDALIIETSNFRKAALRAVAASKSTGATDSSALLRCCLRVADSCVTSLHRYCEQHDQSDTAQAKLNGADQERRFGVTIKLAPSFVETAMAIAQQTVKANAAIFEDVDTVLSSCFELYKLLQLAQSKEAGLAVKLSALYYNLHLMELQRGSAVSNSMMVALSRSVQVLEQCEPQEQEAGSLLAKMEKLVKYSLQKGPKTETLHTIEKTLARAFQYSAIVAALGRSTKISPSRCFDAEPQNVVIRLLHLLNGATSSQSKDTFQKSLLNASAALSPERQAVFLEMTVALYPDRCSELLPYVIGIYSDTELQYCRLRALLSAEMKGSCENGPDAEVDMSKAKKRQVQMFDGDAGLTLHYSTCISAMRAVRDEDVAAVEASIESWKSAISDCKNAEDLTSSVDDLNTWLRIIEDIAASLEGRGMTRLCTATLRIKTMTMELDPTSRHDELVSTYTRLATQVLHQGYSSQAKAALDRARVHLQSGEISTQTQIQLHVAYGEYLSQIGDVDGVQDAVQQAQVLSIENPSFLKTACSSSNVANVLAAQQIVVRVWNVYARLSRSQGNIASAIDFARRAVKLSQRIWTSQESLSSHNTSSLGSDTIDTGISANTSNPPVISRTHDALKAPNLLPFAPQIIASYRHLAELYAHIGNLTDATSWGEQARKVAVSTRNQAQIVSTNCFLANCYIDAARLDKAQTHLDAACEHKGQIKDTVESVQLYASMAAMWSASKEYDDEEEMWAAAHAELTHLRLSEAEDNLSSNESDRLVAAMGKMQIADPIPNTTDKSGKRGGRSVATRAPTKTRAASRSDTESPTEKEIRKHIPLDSLEATLLRHQANSLLGQGRLREAASLLDKAKSFSTDSASQLQQTLAVSDRLFMDGMESMQADFTFGVLPESTISLPATLARPEVKEVVKAAPSASRPRKTAPSKAAKGVATKSAKMGPVDQKAFVNDLTLAKDSLHGNLAYILRNMSTSLAFRAARSFRSVVMLLSAVQQNFEGPILHPLLATCAYESMYRIEAQRARHVLQIENTKIGRNEILQWPTEVNEQHTETIKAEDMQAKFIDIVPRSWAAISISMDDAKQDIILTRYKAGQSPFILRLPLSRHKSRDMDEDVFDFASGRAEMAEIIDLANFSAHDAKDMNTSQGKKDWWAAREALDARLKDLLVNIENIWLGGFRGIFAPQDDHTQLLANFLQAFEEIFKRHLPSRQTRGEAKPLNLDPRILQLFTGLGDPSDESLDLDEPLMDLLYFVIDILQFNGERNAYDEIDLDAMCIETLDALKVYHHAVNTLPASKHHTILILDKSLHLFPWESLPCMARSSVSRLPSLVSLQTRLSAMQDDLKNIQARPPDQSSHLISREHGFSILNPGGDLKNTQAALQPCLSSLPPSWTHRTNAPTETELETNLASNDLFLYFGHGSGAQYIRPRSIKKLEKAPVTWLMGCSSSAIADNGEFEPSGMVLAYLQAGAPAIVGTLWDVTDRDCDRASAEIGQRWGLWKISATTQKLLKGKKRSEETETARAPKTPARKSKKAGGSGDEVKARDGSREPYKGTSLTEAVLTGRDACYLRYLNGAAFVVYGVPVCLVD